MITSLYIKNYDGHIWDIHELVTKVSFTENMNNGCGKLEFSYLSKNDLIIQNGFEVAFVYGATGVFGGRVFKTSRNEKGEISVTAYDQLRYAKAKDFFSTEGQTAADMVKKMCSYYNLNKGHIESTQYVLNAKTYCGTTWLDAIYEGITNTLINKGEWYVLRDEFGYITLRNVEDLMAGLIIGDASLCYGYIYEKSIDDDFYNQVLILGKKDNVNNLRGTKDESSIKKYGMLQFFDSRDNTSAAQAQVLADLILNSSNNEKESLSMECLGDTRIRAGVGFYGMIEDLMGHKASKNLIVKSVTHEFLPVHTMSMEVSTWR